MVSLVDVASTHCACTALRQNTGKRECARLFTVAFRSIGQTLWTSLIALPEHHGTEPGLPIEYRVTERTLAIG